MPKTSEQLIEEAKKEFVHKWEYDEFENNNGFWDHNKSGAFLEAQIRLAYRAGAEDCVEAILYNTTDLSLSMAIKKKADAFLATLTDV